MQYSELKGDFVFVHVYKGQEVVSIISQLIESKCTNIYIHIYDSFPDIPVRIHNQIFEHVSLKNNVIDNISKLNYPIDKIIYHNDYTFIPNEIAYLSINTYSYQKTSEAISKFKSNLQKDAIIKIDKYGIFTGCTQAVDEHLKDIDIIHAKSLPSFNKVIIWGYPLHTHSHSYIHACWVKAFKYLGYDTFWFSDDNFDENFDYTNCLFITEGYADFKIPLHKSNIYYVHVCVDPQRYLDAGVRFIDMRYNVIYLNDVNYDYDLNKSLQSGKAQQISYVTYYEELEYYPAIYISWATDLLPHEFDYSLNNNNDQNNTVYMIGSAGSHHMPLSQALSACGINMKHIDCWKEPISFEENMQLMKQNIVNIDIRSDQHKNIGYIPCRVFKAISYGKLGITNSKRVEELFGKDNIIYNDNISELVKLALSNKDNYKLIIRQMQYVQKHHTYLNRIDDLNKCLKLAFLHI